MNYSAIFSNAHKKAKQLMTTGLFASYRGAFSVALSELMIAAWAEFNVEKLANANKKALSSFRDMPLQDSKFLGFVKLNGCELIRGVWVNDRSFYVEGDEYDFECASRDLLGQFITEKTSGYLGAMLPTKAARKAAQPRNLSPIKKQEIKKPVSVKRPVSGRGLGGGRRVAKVSRFWAQSIKDQSNQTNVFH